MFETTNQLMCSQFQPNMATHFISCTKVPIQDLLLIGMWAVNQSGDASSEPLNIPLDIPSHHINGDIIMIYIYIFIYLLVG